MSRSIRWVISALLLANPAAAIVAAGAESPLTIERFTAAASGSDAIQINVTLSNQAAERSITLDACPSYPTRTGEVSGHLELYVSRDGTLDVGDWPLQAAPSSDTDLLVPAAGKVALRWLARLPPRLDPRGSKLILVVHAGGPVTQRNLQPFPHAVLVRGVDDPCATAVCAVPKFPTAPVRPRPAAGEAGASAPLAWQMAAGAGDRDAEYALLSVHSEPASRWRRDGDLWQPRPGGIVVKHLGSRALEIGDGDRDQLEYQLYAGRLQGAQSTDLSLRPAGGFQLQFPQGTRLEPGDAIFLVNSKAVLAQQREDHQLQPLTAQRARILPNDELEPLERCPWCVCEIRGSLRVEGVPQFTRRLQVALPSTVWVKE